MAISFYDSKGEFTGTLSGDASVMAKTLEVNTKPWVAGEWFGKPYYVLNGVATAKPVNPTTVSGDTLLNVPIPAKVLINNAPYDTNEATVELSFTHPGTYNVKVIAWPYLDKEFLIENPA